MRIAIVIGALLLSAPAFADEPKVEEWVGAWSGKATSNGCAEVVPKKLTLDVAVTSQGGLRSNGDLILEGLGDLDWTGKGKGLVLSREGVTGSLKPAKGSAKLALTTEDGCVVKATLKRTTSGIASCDRVRALATVKAQCGSLPSETRGESLTDVEASWSTWGKLKGKKKKAQAAACTERATTLEGETSGCVSGVPTVTGLRECDAYIAAMRRYIQCDKVPQAARDGAKQGLDAMTMGWGDISTIPEEAKTAANDACKQATDALRQGASAMGCPL